MLARNSQSRSEASLDWHDTIKKSCPQQHLHIPSSCHVLFHAVVGVSTGPSLGNQRSRSDHRSRRKSSQQMDEEKPDMNHMAPGDNHVFLL